MVGVFDDKTLCCQCVSPCQMVGVFDDKTGKGREEKIARDVSEGKEMQGTKKEKKEKEGKGKEGGWEGKEKNEGRDRGLIGDPHRHLHGMTEEN